MVYSLSVALGNTVFVSGEGQNNGCLPTVVSPSAVSSQGMARRALHSAGGPLGPVSQGPMRPSGAHLTGPNAPLSVYLHDVAVRVGRMLSL